MGEEGLYGKTAGTDEIGQIVTAFENAINRKDLETAAELLKRSPLELWFGIRAEKLLVYLERIIQSGYDTTGVARAIFILFSEADASRMQISLKKLSESIKSEPGALILESVRMLYLRLNGRAVEALERVDRVDDRLLRVEPVQYTRKGWQLFFSVQAGRTAMLAGDNSRALRELSAAHFHPFIPSLAFLTRDAYVKAALVHAAFGCPAEARQLLIQADKVPRTSSWAEEIIDASAKMAEVILEVDDPCEGKRLVDSIPRQHIGEMWPYYVLAMHRSYERAGHRVNLKREVEVFDRLSLPRVTGQGFSGSVIPTVLGTIAMAGGDLKTARSYFDQADQTLPGTLTMQAHLALLVGKPNEAIELMSAVAEVSRGMRQLELWRFAILSRSWFSLEEHDNLCAVLSAALELPGGLYEYEVLHFSDEVRAFAEERFQGWPTGSDRHSEFMNLISGVVVPLTEREVEILRLLRKNVSRAEMADALFVTLNTLKTHLAAIYRKLGVTSKAAAIVEAEHRGLI